MRYNWQILCAFWVYNLIFWYTCTLWDGHQLSWLTYHFLTYLPLFVVRTLMMSCLSKFQVCYVVLLPIVMWLYIRFPQYIHLAWLQLRTPWPISPHFPSPNLWQPCYSLLLWVLTVLYSKLCSDSFFKYIEQGLAKTFSVKDQHLQDIWSLSWILYSTAE